MTPRQEVLRILAILGEQDPQVNLGRWLAMFAGMLRRLDFDSICQANDEELLAVMNKYLEDQWAHLLMDPSDLVNAEDLISELEEQQKRFDDEAEGK